MKKDVRKRQRQLKTYLILIIIVTILCISLFLSLKSLQKTNTSYKIENRVEDIKKAKEKDTEDYYTIGWLKMQGTNIDLPIIGYKRTNTDFPVSLGNYAWNFSPEEKYYNNIIIMGHNIMNLSNHPKLHKDYFQRFDDLMSYVYYDFAKENEYIQYTVNGKTYLYKIYAVGFEYSYKVQEYKIGNLTAKEKRTLINGYKKNSLYQYDTDVSEKDDLITVMTCTRMFTEDGNKRDFLVNARRVREKEATTKYDVKEKKEYKKVKKILEEDDYENESA